VIRATAGGVEVSVHVTPRAGANAIGSERGGALAIRLAASPVEGAANEALVAYLAQVLDIPKSAVRIAGGERSRHKRMLIARLTAAEVRTKLIAAQRGAATER
jgi:uncharacterized protein